MTTDTRRNWPWYFSYLAVGAVSLVFLLVNLEPPEGSGSITQAGFRVADSDDWQLVALPHSWRDSLDIGSGSYRVEISIDQVPQETWAILLPTHRCVATLHINGTFIGDSGRQEPPLSRNHMTPRLFPIPAMLIHPGVNVLEIRLSAEPADHGFLDTLSVAPHDLLKSRYRTLDILLNTVPAVISGLILVLVVFMAALWLRRRQDTEYLYFSAMAAAWTLSNLNMIMVDIPLPLSMWDPLMFASVMWMVIAATIFVHRFYELDRARLDRGAILGGCVFTLVLFLLPNSAFYVFVNVLLVPAEFVLGCYVIVTLVTASARRGGAGERVLAMAGVVVLACGGHDALVSVNIIRSEVVYFLPYAQALVLTVFAFLLGQRYLGSVAEAELLNRTLEERIRVKEQELNQAFEQRRRLEAERLLAQERERLTREMHDGLGGHLVSILALSEQDGEAAEIHRAAELALADLRIMISSLDLGEAGLPELLGTFRDRISGQLEHQGLTIAWDVHPVSDVPDFNPRKALNILRILQEAVTNVLRHAGASRITFELVERAVEPEVRMICLSVVDNGRSGGDWSQQGHGLNHMRERAAEIGATLDIARVEGGTAVRLIIPPSNR